MWSVNVERWIHESDLRSLYSGLNNSPWRGPRKYSCKLLYLMTADIRCEPLHVLTNLLITVEQGRAGLQKFSTDTSSWQDDV